jgi:hypothetical protein
VVLILFFTVSLGAQALWQGRMFSFDRAHFDEPLDASQQHPPFAAAGIVCVLSAEALACFFQCLSTAL